MEWESIENCEVCKKKIKVRSKLGICPYCNWHNGYSDEKYSNVVQLPNLISLDKARRLCDEGKAPKPNFNELIQFLLDYREINFLFNKIYYTFELVYNKNNVLKIRLYNSHTKKNELFDNVEDFINNAKVDDIFIRDICWDKINVWGNAISDKKVKTETKCVICGNNYFADIYGQGECGYCGWYNNKLGETNDNEVVYPNLISLNKAKKLYQDGKPFRPDLDDFLDGLFMYSEMVFTYNDNEYEVFLRANRNIVLYSSSMQQEYTTREDFKNKANINGALLKDIWHNVINADYM